MHATSDMQRAHLEEIVSDYTWVAARFGGFSEAPVPELIELNLRGESLINRLVGPESPHARELRETLNWWASQTARAERILAILKALQRDMELFEATALPPYLPAHIPSEIPRDGVELEAILSGVETFFIETALDMTQGNHARAARLLGITSRSLRYRLAKLGLK